MPPVAPHLAPDYIVNRTIPGAPWRYFEFGLGHQDPPYVRSTDYGWFRQGFYVHGDYVDPIIHAWGAAIDIDVNLFLDDPFFRIGFLSRLRNVVLVALRYVPRSRPWDRNKRTTDNITDLVVI